MACEQMRVNDPQMLFGWIADGELLHRIQRSRWWRVECAVHQHSNLSVYVDADD
jgi:hypothetical protein